VSEQIYISGRHVELIRLMAKRTASGLRWHVRIDGLGLLTKDGRARTFSERPAALRAARSYVFQMERERLHGGPSA
jgi:hypothetical protein